jgi:hypothetical protein
VIVSYEDAVDEVLRLDRTIGYPKEHESRSRLVDALIDACNRHGVTPDRVISECLRASQYCPTDHDLLTFAGGLRPVESWQQPKPSKCAKCHGSGFEISYTLHTVEGHGEYAFVKKELITEEQYDLLSKQVDWQRQKVFSGAKRCTAGCPVPAARP